MESLSNVQSSLGDIESPIGVLAGEQILKAKGVGAKKLDMLVAIAEQAR